MLPPGRGALALCRAHLHSIAWHDCCQYSSSSLCFPPKYWHIVCLNILPTCSFCEDESSEGYLLSCLITVTIRLRHCAMSSISDEGGCYKPKGRSEMSLTQERRLTAIFLWGWGFTEWRAEGNTLLCLYAPRGLVEREPPSFFGIKN